LSCIHLRMDASSSNPTGPAGVEVAPGVYLPEQALRFTSMQAGGPGGQHVNKVATKIRLRVSMDDLATVLDAGAMRRLATLAGSRLTRDGDLIFTSQASRSAISNRRNCLELLRQLLTQAMRRPRRRKKKRVSASAKRKRLESKRHRGQTKRLRRPPTRE